MDQKAQKALPCPFCASENTKVRHECMGEWFVYCLNCVTEGPVGKSYKDAIHLWNQRPNLAQPSLGENP